MWDGYNEAYALASLGENKVETVDGNSPANQGPVLIIALLFGAAAAGITLWCAAGFKGCEEEPA